MNGQLLPPHIAARVDAWVQRCKVPAVCLVLAAITFAVFGQTAGFGFINYDDNRYVYENPVVERGLTLKGAAWALTYGEIGHWHPLTWLTHMADCQAFGLWAGGHHLTNVALHAVAAALLFLALREMTGNLWRCAFVAAVFAIHPLRVESVAWVAERKDVLSGVFFMLTLWAYARYVRQPSPWRYAPVALAYALGLLSKNTLVTLPFVLLLLDWWPLHRVTLDGAGGGKVGAAKLVALFGGLVKEKIPLFLLSAGSCVATFLVPEKVFDSQRQPFLERIGNALVSYGIYLRQMVFPAGLAIPYLNPPNGLPFWKVALAFAVLAAISMLVLACWKKRPYLLVGWLWYLGMLVPAIGFVQISYYAHADRYTYLPGIGLVLAGTWALGDGSLGWKHRRAGLGGLMAAVVGVLMVCAWIQTGYWKSNEILWIHALDCTTGNHVAQNNLGDALRQKGRMDDAITHYEEALQIAPDYAEAHNNLGLALFQKGSVDEAMTHLQKAAQIAPHDAAAQNNLGYTLLQMGRVDEAITHCQQALQTRPDFAEARNNLGNALGQKGRVDEAITQFQQALQINPALAEAHNNLGNALRQKGRVDEAISQYQMALQINPAFANAHNNLGSALGRKARVEEAIACYQKALEIKPDFAEARNNLAWLLATCPKASLRNGNKAVELARQANGLTGGKNPAILKTLAAAFAEAGRFSEAMETAQRALHLAEAQSKTNLAGQLQAQLKLYQAGSPFHSPEQTH
jgi:tetratricopeptide (TPR) repeat protein